VAASIQLLTTSSDAYPFQPVELPLNRPLSVRGLSSAFTVLLNAVLPALSAIVHLSTWAQDKLTPVAIGILVSFPLLLLFLLLPSFLLFLLLFLLLLLLDWVY